MIFLITLTLYIPSVQSGEISGFYTHGPKGKGKLPDGTKFTVKLDNQGASGVRHCKGANRCSIKAGNRVDGSQR
jgi:hypothetical protein